MKTSAVEMEPQKKQPNWMGMTQQQFTPSLHLVPFFQLYIYIYIIMHLLVVCIGGLWKAVGWVVLGVDVHRE